MRLDSWALSITGHRRENEDAVLIPGHAVVRGNEVVGSSVELGVHGQLCIVADGVGSRQGGAWAARTALQAIHQHGQPNNTVDELNRSVLYAQKRVQHEGRKFGAPATTVAGISCNCARILAFNAGDSRVYKLTDQAAVRVSIDHVSRTDGRSINRFLGGHVAQASPYVVSIEPECQQSYLICSDGLHGFVSASDLMLPVELNPITALEALVELALLNGSTDNISAIFCKLV